MENRIQGTTRLLGLIGYPLKHSKSPHMHNKSFQDLGLDYVYMAFEVQDGHIKEALDSLKTLNAIGGNITMPHKTKIVEYLDDISPETNIIKEKPFSPGLVVTLFFSVIYCHSSFS
jgi:shikimate 5-dehydrogenase